VTDTAVRGSIDDVHRLAGVAIVLDIEDGRVVAQRGVDEDPLEIVLHFAGTWDELLAALMPVLGDALGTGWTPERWWACSGGDQAAMGRDGRAVIVDAAAAAPFLAALAGDGTVAGVRVW
jgi:hypothetical protein